MVRSLIAGLIVAVLLFAASLMMHDPYLSYWGNGMVALACLGLSAIVVGALISGDRVRAGYRNETQEGQDERMSWATKLFLFGLPNLVCLLFMLTMTQ
ncbi:MAG: DUF5316 domain-containing protein [Alicyclobacillus sp.]|nr:DUF5316 domain-containing protein [Alicyclobacillus sp.]